MAVDSEEIKKLTQSFFATISSTDFASTVHNKNMQQYFESKSNTILAETSDKLEQKRTSQMRVNDKLLEQQRLQNKNFDIEWNVDFCGYCKCAYWPENCTVYTRPRARVTARAAKLNAKHRLFNYRPKYKSYKDRIVRKVICKGLELIYECRACTGKNVIVREVRRSELRTVTVAAKFRSMHIRPAGSLLNVAGVTSAGRAAVSLGAMRPPVTVAKNKFKSLQAKLKQSEAEQARQRSEKERSFGSLASFLENLN
jgi:hypothetical protein